MVSVIIPIYNVEKYLCQCVDSVLAQTFADLEIILVDDGSPDRCGAICDEYAKKDSRVRVIHKQNGGLSDARNAGTEAARGDYIYYLDSDDFIRQDAIEKMVARIEEENADLVYFNAETLFEDFEDPDYRECFIRKHSYRTDRGATVLGAHLKNREYYSCAYLYLMRKGFLDKTGLRFLKGIIHEDELFTVTLFIRAERAAYLNEALYIRRLRAGSIMSGMLSARSIGGLYACINGYIRDLRYFPAGTPARKVLLYNIREKLAGVLDRFLLLDKQQQKLAYPTVRKTARLAAEVGYCGSNKLRMKYKLLPVYIPYGMRIRPVKNRLVDAVRRGESANKK
ncbi:MAG: glycosyltransferase [Ruminococcus sp.]|nr:glycosyltransferase [Ruminococcus sp.]